MAGLGELGRRAWLLVNRRRADRELDAEMALHQDLLARRRQAGGAKGADAQLLAKQDFGSPLRIRERTHEAVGWPALEDFVRDAVYGVRSLVRSASFAIAAIGTLALGIGATTAIFSLVNGIVLQPLPFAAPDRLVQMYGTPAVRGEAVGGLATLRSESQSFDGLAGYNISARYLQSAGGPERVMTVTGEREFFSVLGVLPLAGRTFRSDDPATVAVISEQFWRRALNGRDSAIGSTLALNGNALTVIGIMPESFQFPYGAASVLHSVAPQARTDVWVPFDPPTDPALRGGRFGYVTGRLKPGISIQQADSELAVIASRMAAEDPNGYGGRGVRLEPLSEAIVARPIRRSLLVLLASVIVVLALAAVNVANLFLVRITLRSREIAARAAFGAGPARLARQFVTESLVVAVLGGIVGLALAWGGMHWIAALAAAQLPRLMEVGLNAGVFAFLLVICAVVGLLIGLTPALAASRLRVQHLLQASGGHATMSGRLQRVRDTFVVIEVALALVLATGAATLIAELIRLRHTDLGMTVSNVITFHMLDRPPTVGIVRRGPPPESETRAFYDIADRVRQIPGVRAAGFTQVLPLQNWGWSANSIDFTVRGRPPVPSPPFTFDLRYVTPGYFEALGIPIRRGRGFADHDTRDGLPVVIINETLARRAFQHDDPVGLTTSRGTIVGVVGDIRNANLDQETLPELYYPIAQNWSQLSELGMTLVVRTDGPPLAVIDPVRQAVREINPTEAIFDVKTLEQIVGESMSAFTLYLMLMTVFGALAIGLALTGTYGVMAYASASRSREFAIRIALGASRSHVMALVIRHGLVLAAFGVIGGLILAQLAMPVLQALPMTVRPPGPTVLLTVAALVGGVAVIASAIPGRRAAAAEPLAVLRNQ